MGFREPRMSNRRDFGNRRNPNHSLPEGSEENAGHGSRAV
jgi:hypothetical protein